MKKINILPILSSAGVILTAYIAYKNANKIKNSLYKVRENKFKDLESNKEFLKVLSPVIVVSASTISCILIHGRLTAKQVSYLTASGALASRCLSKYRNKVREIYGKETDQKIVAEIAKDDWTVYPEIPVSNSGEEELFYDSFNNKYFYATTDRVQQAMYHINRKLQLRGDATIEEFYNFIGLSKDDFLDHVGWDINYFIEKLGITPSIDFYTEDIVLDNGQKAKLIGFDWEPVSELESYEV